MNDGIRTLAFWTLLLGPGVLLASSLFISVVVLVVKTLFTVDSMMKK